mmetsp:Transcript_101284/g.292906  ORF Transcript_101284/g.292906 Transcript_101284/m.292906 type:complete len:236 (-) Transcript_101284:50-757(-)
MTLVGLPAASDKGASLRRRGRFGPTQSSSLHARRPRRPARAALADCPPPPSSSSSSRLTISTTACPQPPRPGSRNVPGDEAAVVAAVEQPGARGRTRALEGEGGPSSSTKRCSSPSSSTMLPAVTSGHARRNIASPSAKTTLQPGRWPCTSSNLQYFGSQQSSSSTLAKRPECDPSSNCTVTYGAGGGGAFRGLPGAAGRTRAKQSDEHSSAGSGSVDSAPHRASSIHAHAEGRL